MPVDHHTWPVWYAAGLCRACTITQLSIHRHVQPQPPCPAARQRVDIRSCTCLLHADAEAVLGGAFEGAGVGGGASSDQDSKGAPDRAQSDRQAQPSWIKPLHARTARYTNSTVGSSPTTNSTRLPSTELPSLAAGLGPVPVAAESSSQGTGQHQPVAEGAAALLAHLAHERSAVYVLPAFEVTCGGAQYAADMLGATKQVLLASLHARCVRPLGAGATKRGNATQTLPAAEGMTQWLKAGQAGPAREKSHKTVYQVSAICCACLHSLGFFVCSSMCDGGRAESEWLVAC